MRSWRVSDHAALRWADRFEPELADMHAAKEKLHALCPGMVDTKGRRGGKRLYAHPNYPLALFCVAHDLNQPVPTLVTVLDTAYNQPARTSLVAPQRTKR